MELSQKKEFVKWLLKSVSFKRREAYWILNYLLNHDMILNNVRFVQKSDETPRGLLMVDVFHDEPGLLLKKGKHFFDDPEQIFHEIRMNWREALFLEILFKDANQHVLYLSVLEDNPYAPWSESVDEEFLEELEGFFLEEERQYRIRYLEASIDRALEEEDKESFFNLLAELQELQKENNFS